MNCGRRPKHAHSASFLLLVHIHCSFILQQEKNFPHLRLYRGQILFQKTFLLSTCSVLPLHVWTCRSSSDLFPGLLLVYIYIYGTVYANLYTSYNLIRHSSNTVYSPTGINVNTEVEYIGEKSTAFNWNLHKLHLRYQTDKGVAKAKNDPELFSMPESSDAARLFRYLVEPKGTTTFELYLRATPKNVQAARSTPRLYSYKRRKHESTQSPAPASNVREFD